MLRLCIIAMLVMMTVRQIAVGQETQPAKVQIRFTVNDSIRSVSSMSFELLSASVEKLQYQIREDTLILQQSSIRDGVLLHIMYGDHSDTTFVPGDLVVGEWKVKITNKPSWCRLFSPDEFLVLLEIDPPTGEGIGIIKAIRE